MRGRPREGHRRVYTPRREEVVGRLAAERMLPAIYFVFSRAGCDRSVRFLMESGVRLTDRTERDRIREIAEERTSWVDEDDLNALGYPDLVEAWAAGIASAAAVLPAGPALRAA